MRKNFELNFKKVKYPEEDILNEEDILSEDILSLTDWAVVEVAASSPPPPPRHPHQFHFYYFLKILFYFHC